MKKIIIQVENGRSQVPDDQYIKTPGYFYYYNLIRVDL